jgi:hypothetical protein
MNKIIVIILFEFFCFFFVILASNSPGNNSLLTTTFTEPNNSIIKSTNFTGSVPITRSEIRHKSEIEIEVKQEKQQQQQQQLKKPNSPVSNISYPPIVRPSGITNKRIPTVFIDEHTYSPQYPTPKRRFLTNSIQTQTPPLLSNQHEQQITISKNEKIQVLIRELTDCQVRIYQNLLFFSFVFTSFIHTAGVNLSLLFSRLYFLCAL